MYSEISQEAWGPWLPHLVLPSAPLLLLLNQVRGRGWWGGSPHVPDHLDAVLRQGGKAQESALLSLHALKLLKATQCALYKIGVQSLGCHVLFDIIMLKSMHDIMETQDFIETHTAAWIKTKAFKDSSVLSIRDRRKRIKNETLADRSWHMIHTAL